MNKANKHWALALCLVLSASYCYSEPYSYGSATVNNALSWDMSVLPKETGLTVNGVVYQYTAVKRPEDNMLVHVQNLNAKGDGYIFRETDDWSRLPGNTINKLVSVDNIPIGYWGKGSIEVEGAGAVEKPTVVYTYRIDHCFNAEITPGCPGYKPILPDQKVEVYSAVDDAAVKAAMQKTEQEYKQSEQKKEAKEKALKEADSAIEEAGKVSQTMLLQAMNNVTNINAYYGLKLNGGVYKDSVALIDSKLPENRFGLRNGLAQQILHTKMIDMQYERQQ